MSARRYQSVYPICETDTADVGIVVRFLEGGIGVWTEDILQPEKSVLDFNPLLEKFDSVILVAVFVKTEIGVKPLDFYAALGVCIGADH